MLLNYILLNFTKSIYIHFNYRDRKIMNSAVMMLMPNHLFSMLLFIGHTLLKILRLVVFFATIWAALENCIFLIIGSVMPWKWKKKININCHFAWGFWFTVSPPYSWVLHLQIQQPWIENIWEKKKFQKVLKSKAWTCQAVSTTLNPCQCSDIQTYPAVTYMRM